MGHNIIAIKIIPKTIHAMDVYNFVLKEKTTVFIFKNYFKIMKISL
jgi:hypothetical protein